MLVLGSNDIISWDNINYFSDNFIGDYKGRFKVVEVTFGP